MCEELQKFTSEIQNDGIRKEYEVVSEHSSQNDTSNLKPSRKLKPIRYLSIWAAYS